MDMPAYIYIVLIVYILCLLPLLRRHAFPALGFIWLKRIHFASVFLLLLNMILSLCFDVSLRGEKTEFILLLLSLFSAIVIFNMYRKVLSKLMQKYTGIWFTYPLLLIVSMVNKLAFAILALPLLLLGEGVDAYASQPGSKLTSIFGFMNNKNTFAYKADKFLIFEKNQMVRVDYIDGSKLHKDSIESYRVVSEEPAIEITWYDYTKDTARGVLR